MATARCTWTAVSGVDGYNVYLKSNGEFVKQNSELITDTVYDIENLEDGNYEAYATSVLNSVESDASNVKGFEVGGITETAIEFNGTSSFARITNSTNIPRGADARYFKAKIKCPAHSENTNPIISYGPKTTNRMFELWVNASTGLIQFVGWANSHNVNVDPFENEIVDVAVSYDGTTIKLYFNNVEVYSETTTLNTSTGDVHFGRRGVAAEAYFPGQMLKLDMWDTASPTTDNGNVFSFPIDEGTGTVINDVTANNNDADLTDVTWVTL